MAEIRIEELQKTYRIDGREIPVLRGLSCTLDADALTCVIGRSGCGKTTLLKLLAGLEAPDGGQIRLPEGAKTGVMFQEARLMPWLNCEKNITFGLKSPNAVQTAEMVRLVGLTGFEKAYPSQLSGGMQQRAALARTLIRQTSLILMDEPFAALDSFTRESMQKELMRIREASRKGIVLVTHNLDEALLLGDRILLLGEGVVQKDYLLPYPAERDLLSEPFIHLKKEILQTMKSK